MALSTYVDAFTIPTSAAGTTIVRTGYGFQPKALLLWCSGRTESVDAVGGQSQQWCVGFATSPTTRTAMSIESIDAAASANAKNLNTEGACLQTLLTDAAVDGLLDVQSFDANGVTFIIDDAFTTTIRVTVWALGGTDITTTQAGSFSTPLATGTQNVVLSPAFQPSIVFLVTSGQAVTAHARHSLGYGIDATQQGVSGYRSRDGSANSDAVRYSTESAIVALPIVTTASLGGRAQFVTMQSDGFQLNWTIALGTPARPVHYLAIQGGAWRGFTSATRTDTTAWSSPGLGFTPTGLLVSSVGTTAHTTVATVHALLTLGAASSASNRAVQGCSEEDSLGSMEVATIVEHDAIYARLDLADGIGGLMDIQSFDANGVTFVMDDPDPDAAFFWAVACGSAVAGQTRSFTANVLGQTTTPPPLNAWHREFTAASASVTNTPPALGTLQRALTATVLSATTTPPPRAQTARALSTTATGTTHTPAITGGIGATTRPLTATLAGATTTPATVGTLSRRLTALLTSPTATPPAVLVTTRALIGTVSGQTQTPVIAADLPSIRSLTAVIGGVTNTPPIATGAPPGPTTTLYLQDRTLATLWALRITNGVMVWDPTTGTADPEPLLLDQANLTTIWTLYIDNGVLQWEVGGTTPAQLLLQDTATPTLWDVQIYAMRLTWINAIDLVPPFTHYTLHDRVLATIWRVEMSHGQLSWSPTMGDVQPEPVLLDRGDDTTLRTLFIANGQLRWEVGGISPAILLLDDTATETIWDLRIRHDVLEWGPAHVFLATLPGRTTTPAIAIQLPGEVQWSASIDGVTATPPIVAAHRRSLTTALSGLTHTPAIVVQMAGMVQFMALVSSTTTTPPVALRQHRTFTAHSPGSTTTPAVPVSLRRALVATASASTQTPAIMVQMAGLVQLTATIGGVTSTPDLLARQVHALLSSCAGVTSTAGTVATLRRGLTGSVSGSTNTPLVAVTLRMLRSLTAVMPAASSTPAALGTLRRPVTAVIAGSTTTPTTLMHLRRAFVGLLPGATTTPTPLLRHARALRSQLLGTTQTPAILVTRRRALTSTLLGATSTPPTMVQMAGLVQLTAFLSGTTSTPPIVRTVVHRLTVTLPASTLTPDVIGAQFRRFIATIPSATTTPTVLHALARNLRSLVSSISTTPPLLVQRTRALTGVLVGTTTTPDTVIRLRRRLTGILPNVTRTPDITYTQRRSFRTLLAGLSVTPAAVFTQQHQLTAHAPGSTRTSEFYIFMTGQVLWITDIVATTHTPAIERFYFRNLYTDITGFTSTSLPDLAPGAYSIVLRPPPSLSSVGILTIARPTEEGAQLTDCIRPPPASSTTWPFIIRPKRAA